MSLFDGTRSLIDSKDQIGPKEEQKPRTDQANEPPVVPLAITAEPSAAYASQQNAEYTQSYTLQRRGFWVQVALCFFTAFAFAAAARYASIARYTLIEVQKQTMASQTAAYAACVSAQIARGALVEAQKSSSDVHDATVASTYQAAFAAQSEGPFIESTSLNTPTIGVGNAIAVPFNIRNTGKSGAMNFAFIMRTVFVPTATDPDFTYPEPLTTSGNTPVFVVGGNIRDQFRNRIVQVALKNPDGSEYVATPEDVRAFQRGDKDILFFGKITYEDSFGVSHWITFCRVFHQFDNNVSSTTHHGCIAYNRQDTNTIMNAFARKADLSAAVVPEISCVPPKP